MAKYSAGQKSNIAKIKTQSQTWSQITKFNLKLSDWYIRPNPEDRINRKPEDQKNRPEDQINLAFNQSLLHVTKVNLTNKKLSLTLLR